MSEDISCAKQEHEIKLWIRTPGIFPTPSMGQMHVIGGKEGFDRVL